MRIQAAFLTATICIGLTGCASRLGTQVIDSWSKPGGIERPIERLVAMAVIREEARRRTIEDRMVQEIVHAGRSGVASYSIVPVEEIGDELRARETFEKAGFDGAVVVRPAATKTAERGGRPESTFWELYRRAWPEISESRATRSKRMW